MKILTHLSKEKINSIVQLEERYNFKIDIDNKKYDATLYGYSIVNNAFGRVINSKIKIKNISFEDMSILNFQVGCSRCLCPSRPQRPLSSACRHNRPSSML